MHITTILEIENLESIIKENKTKLDSLESERLSVADKTTQEEALIREQIEPLEKALVLSREKKRDIQETTDFKKVGIVQIEKAIKMAKEEIDVLSNKLVQKLLAKQELAELVDLEKQDLAELKETLRNADIQIIELHAELRAEKEKYESAHIRLAEVEEG